MSNEEIKWEFCEDAEQACTCYNMLEAIDGEGSVRPHDLLKNQEQIDLVENAIAVLTSFEVALDEAGLLDRY